MAVHLRIGVGDLAATCFATSPLYETVAAIQVVDSDAWTPDARPFARRARAELAVRPLGLELAPPLLTGTPTYPEFLTPAPRLRRPTLGDELEVLVATPPAVVLASLARVYARAPRPPAAVELAASPRRVLRRLAEELERAHARLLAPSWPSVQALLDADIAGRALQLAGEGSARMIGGLHPGLSLADSTLRWTGWNADGPDVLDVAPGGVVLLPSAFVGDWVVLKRRTSSRSTVRYGARGQAALWLGLTGDAAGCAPGLAALVGAPRAALLARLRTAHSTAGLAALAGVTPPAVSQHLRVLREAGLVARTAMGRGALHELTTLGRALVDGAGPSGSTSGGRVAR